jgi:hypothetical protein
MNLSAREKTLVGALAGLLAVLALALGANGLARYREGLVQQVELNRRMLEQLQALDAELSQSGAQRGRGLQTSLIGYMEQLADRAGMKPKVQLNPITQAQGARLQAVEVKADQLTLDDLVKLVYTIENAEYVLVIDQLEIAPSFKEKDLIRLTMRVLAQS